MAVSDVIASLLGEAPRPRWILFDPTRTVFRTPRNYSTEDTTSAWDAELFDSEEIARNARGSDTRWVPRRSTDFINPR